MTTTSTGPRSGCRRRPSCSCSAVNSDRPSGVSSVAPGSGGACCSPRSLDHSISRSYVPVDDDPRRATTGERRHHHATRDQRSAPSESHRMREVRQRRRHEVARSLAHAASDREASGRACDRASRQHVDRLLTRFGVHDQLEAIGQKRSKHLPHVSGRHLAAGACVDIEAVAIQPRAGRRRSACRRRRRRRVVSAWRRSR